jgi:hypothetical protein
LERRQGPTDSPLRPDSTWLTSPTKSAASPTGPSNRSAACSSRASNDLGSSNSSRTALSFSAAVTYPSRWRVVRCQVAPNDFGCQLGCQTRRAGYVKRANSPLTSTNLGARGGTRTHYLLFTRQVHHRSCCSGLNTPVLRDQTYPSLASHSRQPGLVSRETASARSASLAGDRLPHHLSVGLPERSGTLQIREQESQCARWQFAHNHTIPQQNQTRCAAPSQLGSVVLEPCNGQSRG